MLDRFMAWLGYVPVTPRPLPRIHNGADAVARGMRYDSFYNEEDGLRDMITALRQDYFQRVGELKPGDTAGLQALGMADRIAREIERKVQSVIETGRIRANDRAHAEKISNIR